MTDDLRPAPGHSASDALLAEQRRVRGSRASIARLLTRRRLRRRVLPPLAVGSIVLMGTGAAGVWVHGIVEPAKTSLVSAPAVTDPSAAIQQATLDQLRQQIAADEATLAALTGGKVSAGLAQAMAAATTAAVQPGQPANPTTNAGAPQAARAGAAKPPAGSLPAGNAAGHATASATGNAAGGGAGAAPTQPVAGGAPPVAQPAQPTAAPAPAQPTTAPAPAPTTAAPAPPPPPPPTVHATSGASGGHG